MQLFCTIRHSNAEESLQRTQKYGADKKAVSRRDQGKATGLKENIPKNDRRITLKTEAQQFRL
jgi:hypothetical protein